MNNLKDKTVKGVFWSVIERFSVQLVQFVITIIMARLLMPSDYGIIGMLAILMSISQVFIDGGFSSALIQKKDVSTQDLSTVFFINVSISILIYLILYGLAPFISDFYDLPILTSVIRIYCLTLIVNGFAGVSKTILTIRIDFKTQSIISLSSSIGAGIFGIYLAYKGFGVWALIYQSILMAIVNVILSFVLVKWFPKLTFSIDSFRKLFSFGSKLLGAQIIGAVYQNLYNVIIGKKFSSTDLGYYSRAEGFNNLGSYNISTILNRVSFPLLSQLQSDNARLISVYTKYISLAGFIMFPISMYLCGASKPIILLLLSNKWAGSIPILQILSISTLWQGITTINLNLLYVKGRSDLVLKLEIIKKVIAFFILFISILFNNLYAMCWGLVVYSLIGFYLNTIYTKKILDYGFIKQIKSLLPYLIPSLVFLISGLLCSEYVTIPYLSIIISLSLAIILYLSICNSLKLYAYNETIGIIKSFLINLR